MSDTRTKDPKWPVCPWDTEPNEDHFEHAGLQCAIYRHERSGHLCGYVQVPEGHPLHGKDYGDQVPESLRALLDDALKGPIGKRNLVSILCANLDDGGRIDLLIDVHGGLTFSGKLRGAAGYWFGFDCAHAGDYSPYRGRWMDDETYRDIEYVRTECRRLAEQLAAMQS